jgi:cytochrome c oxidase subunit 4
MSAPHQETHIDSTGTYVKILLVALFFMHVRHSTKLTKLVVVGGLMWLMILLVLTMTDFATRGLFGVPPK